MGKNVEILTSQLIFGEPKLLQIRQFDDFGWNWSFTKSKQSSENRELVNWFATVLFVFDVEIAFRIIR